MNTMLLRCLTALLLYGSWPASGRVLLAADAPAPAPSSQLRGDAMRLASFFASLSSVPGPAPAQAILAQAAAAASQAASSPDGAQGPAPSEQLSADQLASLNAVIIAYQQFPKADAPSADAPAAAPSADVQQAASVPAASAFMGAPAGAAAPASQGGVIQAYQQGVQAAAPAQLANAQQREAEREAFADAPATAYAEAPAAIAFANAPVATAEAAYAPDPAIELTPAQQEIVREIFTNSTAPLPGAANYTRTHWPDPAMELTPAQRDAIRAVFENSTAAAPASVGKENYGPASAALAPQPAIQLTPEQTREIKAIFDSPAPAPAPYSMLPPTPSAPAWQLALAPGYAAPTAAEDVAQPGEAAPSAWPQAPKSDGGSMAVFGAPQKAPGPATQMAVALQRPLAAAPGTSSSALTSATLAPASGIIAPAMAPVVSLQSSADASNNGLPSIPSAASQVQSFLAGGANSSFAPSQTNSTGEAKAIGNLVANSIKLGSDLAASGHAVSLAADERAAFVEKLKGDFENLSIAIADLPVGLIPFPDRAKVALQKLNTDVVHGVSSGNLDVEAIALDNRDVQTALGGVVAAGANPGNMQ